MSANARKTPVKVGVKLLDLIAAGAVKIGAKAYHRYGGNVYEATIRKNGLVSKDFPDRVFTSPSTFAQEVQKAHGSPNASVNGMKNVFVKGADGKTLVALADLREGVTPVAASSDAPTAPKGGNKASSPKSGGKASAPKNGTKSDATPAKKKSGGKKKAAATTPPPAEVTDAPEVPEVTDAPETEVSEEVSETVTENEVTEDAPADTTEA